MQFLSKTSVNLPHSSHLRSGSFANMKLCMHIWTFHANFIKMVLIKWPPAPLPMGVRIANHVFYAFLNILSDIYQKCCELCLNLEGKTPAIAETVSFHLHFGGISLLFWQLSSRNIFKGWGFMHNFLCRSGHFMQSLAKIEHLTSALMGAGVENNTFCVYLDISLNSKQITILQLTPYPVPRGWGLHT